ncbi:MAG TPA: hypothetical protein VG944_15680 [Fimbriimonas sp.]|nr:hypothetical protein [Fimbriimonas sp.]
MMTALVAFSVLAGATFQQTPVLDKQIYTDKQLGLSFTHPSTWLLEKPNAPVDKKKRGRKKGKPDDTAHFLLPLAGSSQDAELLVMRAEFSGSKETWQQVQADANKDLNRTVDRQWDQEILGVPLLLTRISYTENGVQKTTLTGLLYNDAPDKLLFRLTGPTGDFDKDQYEFTQAMETLRTTNNQLPTEQDPDHPKVAQPVADPGAKHVIFSPGAPPKPILAPISTPLVVSTKNVLLRIPKGWSASHIDGNTLQLSNAGLPYAVDVKVFSVLDSDPPMTALVKASAVSLNDFTTVSSRQDTAAAPNQANCVVSSVWREGSGAKGNIISYEAIGKSGDFYFLATCRPIPGPSASAQRKLLQELIGQTSIESPQ